MSFWRSAGSGLLAGGEQFGQTGGVHRAAASSARVIRAPTSVSSHASATFMSPTVSFLATRAVMSCCSTSPACLADSTSCSTLWSKLAMFCRMFQATWSATPRCTASPERTISRCAVAADCSVWARSPGATSSSAAEQMQRERSCCHVSLPPKAALCVHRARGRCKKLQAAVTEITS